VLFYNAIVAYKITKSQSLEINFGAFSFTPSDITLQTFALSFIFIFLICLLLQLINFYIRGIYLSLFLLLGSYESIAQNAAQNNNYIITKRLLSVEDGLPSRMINDAVQDKAGFVWFASANGLTRYDGNSFKTFNTKNSRLHSNSISNLALDYENHLMISFSWRFNKKFSENDDAVNIQVFDLNDYVFKNIEDIIPEMPFKTTQIELIATDKYGSLDFLISNPIQVWKYKKETAFVLNRNIKNTTEVDSVWLNILKDKFAVSKKDHLNQWYVQQGDDFVNVRDTNDIRYSGENNYSYVFRDRLNNFWFFTINGLYQVSIRPNKFRHLFSANNRSNFAQSTRGIYAEIQEPGPNKIYALFSTGNLRVESENNQIEINAPSGLALLKKNNQLYISNNGLLKYDPVSHSLVTLINDGGFLEIWSLASLSDSIIALGGLKGSLLYNEHSKQLKLIPISSNIKQSPVSVYRFVHSKHKGWIAAAENGIYFISQHLEINDYYGNQHPHKEKRLPFTDIHDFYEDKEGVAWLALNGGGLVRWDWNTPNPMSSQHFKKFTTDDGLPDNILYRIEEDSYNNLWISTYNGLARFNKHDFSFRIYKTKDGLANKEFNRVSSFKDDHGRLYFGGFVGVDAFNPVDFVHEISEKQIPFQLVDMIKFSAEENQLKDVLQEFRSQKKMTLQVGDRFLNISFSLLDFENRIHRYAYRIEGMDDDWNYIDENSIRISGLPYGKLNIRIKAQLSSGTWNKEEIIIPVDVMKPFYLKGWFWILGVFFLVLVFLLIYFIRINRLKRANIKLEEKVQERTFSLTQTLQEKDFLLSEKNILLTEVHHRVKNNLQVINGLLELRKEGIEDEKARAAFDEGKSGVESIAMIHELLYRNEITGTLEFSVIAKNLTAKTAQLFSSQQKTIEFIFGTIDIKLNLDKSITLGLILNELLINAFKYLPANQKNIVHIDLSQIKEGSCEFVFHDNGPGLAHALQFDQATTIGFSIIKRLAKQLKGKATYRFDQGSKFTIRFEQSANRLQS